MSSFLASSEPSDILMNKSSHSSFVGGAMRERSEINLPIGSKLLPLVDEDVVELVITMDITRGCILKIT
jgi:hypothetical protein